MIADTVELLVSEGSPERVLKAVADAVQQVVPYDALALYEADATLRLLRPVLVRDGSSTGILAFHTLSYGTGISGSVAQSGRPELLNHAPREHGFSPTLGIREEAYSVLAVPLRARNVLKGVLSLYRLGTSRLFTEYEFGLAHRFAGLAALAIDNADIRAGLESQAMTDHLTGLYNHRFFQERLSEELGRASRHRAPVSLLIYDIDDFKSINDTYGHLLGDRVLECVASTSRDVCRIEESLCRIGGEEFAVILPGQAGGEAEVLAERLRVSIEAAPFHMETRITVSVGVAEAPRNASSPRELFACADLALFQAKTEGKNRVQGYQGRMLPSNPDLLGDDALSGEWEILAQTRAPTDWPNRSSRASSGERRFVRPDEVRSIAQLKMLHRVSSKLNSLQDVTRIGEAITGELEALIDYQNCRVYLLAQDGETLVPVAAEEERTGLGEETAESGVVKLGEGVTWEAVRSGQTVYVPGISQPLSRAGVSEALDFHESMLAVPLRYDDRVTGVIVLSKLGVEQFDREDARVLEVLASTAGIALENARLFEAQREASRTLEGAYVSTVEALANALEAKDAYTGDHARALAQMALSVGMDLGLQGEALKILELAALFHDIGKIGVPNELIRKPGPLTAAERKQMQAHPEIGERILAPVSFLAPIRPIIRACHERWDGSGYPDGLAGEDIPLEARIIFVCDAFHAMTTDRPYRSALPELEAIRRIELAAGGQFDPNVVGMFVRRHRAEDAALR